MPEPRSQPAPTSPAPPPGIDGPALARAFRGGWTALRDQAPALNAINVFPVPDGDTGTNMSLTMRAAIEEIDRAPSDSLPDVTAAAAQGTLMGAKGNSGVILSQIVGAFAGEDTAAIDAHALDARALARILDRGRAAAYRVVTNPREGTILTAITAAAEAASQIDAAASVEDALAAATAAAHDAARRSPELMPLLKEAGVVDAGAQGLYVMLDGMLRALRGETAPARTDDLGAIDPAWLAATSGAHAEGDRAGYCTEFVIHAPSLDSNMVRDLMRPLGGSLIVVAGPDVTRVHLHTPAPEAAFAAARALGTLSHEKADDMEAQFRRLAATPSGARPAAAALAVVAVGAGPGIEALLRSIGATSVVLGGQTMNPSAGEIRAAIDSAIEATGAADVIVLPDNKNVILAARLAAEHLPGRVHVVPASTIPQGVAALVALNAEAPFEDNVAAMERAVAAVRTGEVTLAARATRVHGIDVAERQPIGLVDGDLVVAEPTIPDAVRACVRRMLEDRPGALVTLYAGEGVTLDDAQSLAGALNDELHVDVEVVDGGQPHYPYLIGVE